jgi:hypothetical protein
LQYIKDFIQSYDPHDVLENRLIDVDKYIDQINQSYILSISNTIKSEAERRQKEKEEMELRVKEV